MADTSFSRLEVTNPGRNHDEKLNLHFTDRDLCFKVSWELRTRGYSVAQSDNFSINDSVESSLEHCEIFLGKIGKGS